MESDGGAVLGGLIALLFLFALYFLPAIIAIVRGHQVAAIILLNLFLGWTFLGWIIALIWACTDKRRHTTIVNNIVTPQGTAGPAP